MPPSIILAHVSWSTPDARPLISDLTLSLGPERTGLVGRNGAGKTTLLRLIAGALTPQAGSIAVEGRLALLKQSVRVAADETIADLFGVRDTLALLARAERGDASADDLARADWSLEQRLRSALDRVGLDAPPQTALAQLSGGQQTRARLAALLFAEPDFLILDEPTNNLDRSGRDDVIAMLRDWRAGAVVVSHDRELLEEMDAIVELTALGAARFGGGWSAYRARKALELSAAEHDLEHAQRSLADLEDRTQTTAERKARRDGAGKRRAARGGAPKIVLGAMKRRAENTTGSQARLAERRRDDATGQAEAARAKIEVLTPLSVTLPSTGLAAGKDVLRLTQVTAGYVKGAPVLRNLDLSVTGPERIAITGANGSGKSTLLAVITGALTPWQGDVRVLAPWALLDQHASMLDPTASIRDNFLRLHPSSEEMHCRAALARFRFRADAALQTVSALSGGQVLRAALACVLGAVPPALLILDEPTNHLDIESIEAIEAGLRAYDGALLIVSHDEAFLDAVGVTRRVAL